MDSRTAVGAEGRGRKAAGVLGTEPVPGSGGTLEGRACYTGRTRKDYSPWAWAFGNTQGILDRWGMVGPAPVEEGPSQGFEMEQVQGFQFPQEPEQRQKEFYLLEAQEVEAGQGAGAL